jgi:hypothetical protein
MRSAKCEFAVLRIRRCPTGADRRAIRRCVTGGEICISDLSNSLVFKLNCARTQLVILSDVAADAADFPHLDLPSFAFCEAEVRETAQLSAAAFVGANRIEAGYPSSTMHCAAPSSTCLTIEESSAAYMCGIDGVINEQRTATRDRICRDIAEETALDPAGAARGQCHTFVIQIEVVPESIAGDSNLSQVLTQDRATPQPPRMQS